jgi:heme/copper-type cytochrome/quinol oxidase subunit 2
MPLRRLAVALALLVFTSSAFAKDVYLSITGTVGNFRTDARVFNPSATKDITITASFLPVGNGNNAGVSSTTFTVAKRQQKVLDDVVAAIFNTSGLGAIRLSCPDDFEATARIYAQVATGTLGQFVPGLQPGAALTKGVLLQLKSNAAFRTNIGAVNPTNSTATVTWRLYDKSNALISTGTAMTMPPFAVIGPTNMAGGLFFGVPGGADLNDSWVSFQADQPIFAYSSVIDNATTDPTFIPAVNDSGETIVVPPPATDKIFTVTLRSFSITFSPEPDIRQGDKVTLNIVNQSSDLHGFSVVDPNGNILVPAMTVPGNKAPISKSFTAAAQGSYTYFCTQPSCGTGHDNMFDVFTVGKASENDRPGY